jgi:glyoxylate/hydroxypyruvate reductase A
MSNGAGARIPVGGIMALMFLSPDDPAEAWREALRAAIPDLDFRIWPEIGDAAEIDVALVWRPPPGELARYPNLRAILSLGAGIDGLLAQPGLPDVPIARMVDPSLTRTMTEYVLLATLRHHRQLDHFERAQRAARWSFALPPQAADRRLGVMGLGVLGGAAAASLAAHGFPVAGWSREAKRLAGVESFTGRAGLAAFLARTDILVCLLPLTRDTAGILNAATFAGLPRGACLINVARGTHLVEADLIAALDSGQLAGATLDVFREEPLPPENPLWRHPKVLITPHVASYASPRTGALGVADNIRRARGGRPLLHQVDRDRGY